MANKLNCLISLLSLLLLLCTTTMTWAADPEVELCKQQCARQPHFSNRERETCKQLCDEYGKDKADRQREEDGPSLEEVERQRVRCKHQCRVAMLNESEKMQCEDKCEKQYWEERAKLKDNGNGVVLKAYRMLIRKVARSMMMHERV